MKRQALYGIGSIASDIQDGDRIPATFSIVTDASSAALRTDFAAMDELFGKFARNLVKGDTPALQEWISSLQTKIDPALFARAFIVQKGLDTFQDRIATDLDAREDFYRQGDATLSQAFAQGHLACVELALIAARALEMHGGKVMLVSGQYVRDEVAPDQEAYGEAHAFLVIEPDDPKLPLVIYDPANPVNTTEGRMPATFAVERDMFAAWRQAADTRQAYMPLRETLSGKLSYYGTSTMDTIFWPDRHVIQTASQPAPRMDRPRDLTPF